MSDTKIKAKSKLRSTEDIKKVLDLEDVPSALKKQALQTAIFNTTKSHPFMGSILQCMNIMYSHALPTAGVMFNNDVKRWDLLINPKFFCKDMDDPKRKAILLHELYHITHKHPLRVPFLKLSHHKRQLMNVAMDMAINQFIKDLPEEGIHLKDFFDTDEKTGKQIPWRANETAEYYYEKLLERFDDPDDDENQSGQGQCQSCGGTGKQSDGQGGEQECPDCKGSGKGKGQGNAGGGAQSQDVPDTMDCHEWDGSAEEKDMLEATEDLVKRAMVKQRFGYDDLPGHVKELLDHIKGRTAELNYKQMILSAMKASLPANVRKNSWTRKSKRFGNKAPGTKNGSQPQLEIFIDTSGSISIEEANEFLDIVDEFLKVGARKCHLNMFHTENYFSEPYKLGQRIKREEFQSGGTCLEHSMTIIAKKRPDLSIFLTDGYFGDVNVEDMVGRNNKFPQCIFIISKDGTEDHPFNKKGEKNEREWSRTVQIPGGNKRNRW